MTHLGSRRHCRKLEQAARFWCSGASSNASPGAEGGEEHDEAHGRFHKLALATATAWHSGEAIDSCLRGRGERGCPEWDWIWSGPATTTGNWSRRGLDAPLAACLGAEALSPPGDAPGLPAWLLRASGALVLCCSVRAVLMLVLVCACQALLAILLRCPSRPPPSPAMGPACPSGPAQLRPPSPVQAASSYLLLSAQTLSRSSFKSTSSTIPHRHLSFLRLRA